MSKRITRAASGVLVEIQRDRMGCLLVFPVTLGMQKVIRERSNTPEVVGRGAYVAEHNADEILSEITARARSSIGRGWPARCWIYDELAWCLFGCEF